MPEPLVPLSVAATSGSSVGPPGPQGPPGATAPGGPATVQQLVWHIDFALGNDANDGLTPGTALKTWMNGYVARTGYYPQYLQPVDVYVHGDMGPSDTMLILGICSGEGGLRIWAVPTVAQLLHTGVLTTAVTHMVAGTNVDETIQDTGIDFSVYVGKMIQINTGSPALVYGNILKAPSLGHARLGWLAYADSTPGNQGYYLRTGVDGGNLTAVGNPYTIIQRPKCFALINLIQGFSPNGPVPAASGSISYFDFSQCGFPTQSGGNDGNGFMVFNSCETTNLTMHDNGSGQGCLINGANGVSSSFGGNTTGGVFQDVLNAPNTWTIGGSAIFYGLVMQNSPLNIDFSSAAAPHTFLESHHGAYGIYVFDCTNAIVFKQRSTILLEAGVMGSGNSGPIITLNGGAQCAIANNAHTQIFFATTSAAQEIVLDNATSGPAYAETNPYGPTADRPYTFANYALSVAAGGFGQRMISARYPATCLGDLV